jgi:uncharacterized protein
LDASAEALLALARDPSGDLTHDAALRAVYATGPAPAALHKVADHVHPLYRPYIEASPFAVLATVGEHGLDTSPRGDAPGFVTVADARTLLLPDRATSRATRAWRCCSWCLAWAKRCA